MSWASSSPYLLLTSLSTLFGCKLFGRRTLYGGKSHYTFDTFLPKVSERSQNLQTPFQAPFLSFLSSLPSVPFPPPRCCSQTREGGGGGGGGGSMTLKMRSPKDGGGVEGRSEEEEKKCSRRCSRHTGCVAENIPVHIVQRRQTPYLAPLLLFPHFLGCNVTRLHLFFLCRLEHLGFW